MSNARVINWTFYSLSFEVVGRLVGVVKEQRAINVKLCLLPVVEALQNEYLWLILGGVLNARKDPRYADLIHWSWLGQ